MAYIGKTPVLGNFVKLDAISVVNGQAAYTMQNGSVNFTSYDNVNQFLVSLNGILQSPTDSFTVSGSTLTFASNLSTGDVIDFVMVLGNTLDVGTPSDNTVTTAKLADDAVTNAKLSFNANQYRNIIINGDMSIAQRATSQSSVTTTGYYTCDRFQWIADYGTVTLSQDTTVPSGQGFAKSYKVDVTTAGTVSSGGYVLVRQKIEGQNLQYLKKGTSNAKSLTLSFWIQSTKTGTYIAELYDADNNRQISKAYTVSSSNTWEKKTLTFDGDTSGAFGNDNGGSLFLNLYLSAGTDYTSGTLNTSWNSSTNANRVVGQVNAQDNTANNIYFTGVQLEAGTTASDFEFLPVDVNLQRCQRYYFRRQGDGSDQRAVSNGFATTTNKYRGVVVFPITMRSNPTLTESALETLRPGQVNDAVSAGSIIDASVNAAMVELIADSGTPYTAGNGLSVRVTSSTSAFIAFDGEL
ncbi:hypothetical protein N9E34_04770 [Opitutales bacterium]|nr:hypothetical protein [Opitutales bacterium]